MEKIDAFFIYNASAGSGKTYTLVKEYLKMALNSSEIDAFRKILAITFTNKAAAEMKERVLSTLEKIINTPENDPKLIEELARHCQISPEKVKERAHRLLRSILHQYSDFSVGTIDSFMHRVVKTFAYDLHLPISFSVELKKENLLEQAVDLVIDRAADDPLIEAMLRGFAETRSDEERNTDIRGEIISMASDLLDDEKLPAINLLKSIPLNEFMRLHKEFSAQLRNTEHTLKQMGEEGMQLLREIDLPVNYYFQGQRGIVSLIKKATIFPSKGFGVNSYVLQSMEKNKWYTDKAPKDAINRIINYSDRLHALCEKLVQYAENELEGYSLLVSINDAIFSMALMREVAQILNDIQTNEHLVHISEFNRKVADVVVNEPAPYVFERLGEKYQHFLIDEFQDTSVLQWQNLLPLVQNGLATQATSLIVGDGKQAIYRFRGGEVEQFIELPNPYPYHLPPVQLERYRLLQMYHSKQDLPVNYRSKPIVVDWNNQFYRTLAENLSEEHQSMYKELNQQADPKKKGGYIEVRFVDSSKDAEIPFEEEQCRQIVELVQQLTTEKKYKLGDIAILTGKNKTGAVVANHLLSENIPVISGESLLVAGSDRVQFLLAWMRLLCHQDVEVNLAHVIRYLLEHQIIPNTSYETWLKTIPVTEAALMQKLNEACINLDINTLRNDSLPELCHRLCNAFGFEIDKDIFLQFFLDTLWFGSGNALPDIPTFLEVWEEVKDKLSIVLPQEADAVKIMTVHKSKGLQFRVVIFAFVKNEKAFSEYVWITDATHLPGNLPTARLKITSRLQNTVFEEHFMQYKKKLMLDRVNAMYVATTRAQDAMYILGDRSHTKNMEGWSNMLHAFCENHPENKKGEHVFAWGDADFTFEEGNQKTSEFIPFEMHHIPGAGWRDKVEIKKHRSAEALSDALRMGTLVHETLSMVAHEDDLETALQHLNAQGGANTEELGWIRDKVNEVVKHPDLNKFFKNGNKIFRERGILIEDGKIFRPDRVTLIANEVTVLEYKTGQKSESHGKQIRQYMAALKQLGFHNIAGKIVYLDASIEIEHVVE
jgi:ATP-dependent exoDNAse (exonuclease V) beta subunit